MKTQKLSNRKVKTQTGKLPDSFGHSKVDGVINRNPKVMKLPKTKRAKTVKDEPLYFLTENHKFDLLG